MIKQKSNILKEISIAREVSGAYLKEGIFLLKKTPNIFERIAHVHVRLL